VDGTGAYEPVDPDAYGGWPWPGGRRVARAGVLGAAAVVVVVNRPDALGTAVAGGVVLLALAGLLAPYVVRRPSPFVVDAPGIHVGGGDTGIEPRILYWETVAEVVLLRRGGRSGRRHHAAGVRLRSAPGGLAVRVALVDRRLERLRL